MSKNQWIEHYCGHCGELIHRMFIYRWLGGVWIPCYKCGHETLFTESKRNGQCEVISIRPLSRANGNEDSHTTPLSQEVVAESENPAD